MRKIFAPFVSIRLCIGQKKGCFDHPDTIDVRSKPRNNEQAEIYKIERNPTFHVARL